MDQMVTDNGVSTTSDVRISGSFADVNGVRPATTCEFRTLDSGGMWDQDCSDRGLGRMARAVPILMRHPWAAMIDSPTTGAMAGTKWPSGLTDR